MSEAGPGDDAPPDSIPSSSDATRLVLDADQIARACARMAHQILEANRGAVGLILLGLGWNFGFVGASAMVLECHRPEERTRVQAFNDFAVFGSVALGSFALRMQDEM